MFSLPNNNNNIYIYTISSSLSFNTTPTTTTTIMAKCASLQQIFENPLPPNPTLIESLSPWHQIKSVPPDLSSLTELFGELQFKDHPCLEQHSHSQSCLQQHEEVKPNAAAEIKGFDDDKNVKHQLKPKPAEVSSFTELFGELYFKEPCPLLVSPVNSHTNDESNAHNNTHARTKSTSSDDGSSLGTLSHRHSDGINLQLCTEGLGNESFDVDSNESADGDANEVDKQVSLRKQTSLESEFKKLRNSKSFPPPISSIGGNGKPWLYFKSFRQEGRFILRQFRIPTQVFFNAYREDGCLRLHPVRPVKQSTETEQVTEEHMEDNVDKLGIAGAEKGERNDDYQQVAIDAYKEKGLQKVIPNT